MNVGPPGGEINPLSLGPVGFVDSIPPTIEKDGIQLLIFIRHATEGEERRPFACEWSSANRRRSL